MIRPKTPPAPDAADMATPERKLAAAIHGGRVYVDVVVPRTDPPVSARLRRLTRREEELVSLELGDWVKRATARGMPPEVRGEINSQNCARVLALAVRRADDTGAGDPPALATLDEWSECDEAQLGALWNVYADLVERTDVYPATCTVAEAAEIEQAILGKDETRLRSFGAGTLTAFLLTSANPRSTSTTSG